MGFWKGFEKRAKEALRKEVSTVAIIHKGKILMGKRKDNDRWTVPGGHLDPGEDPKSGGLREVKEESGITLKSIKHLGTYKADNGYTVHCFIGSVSDNSTTMKDDPDNEVYRWHWMNIPPKEEILNNLHVPFESNCLMKAIGLLKGGKGFKKTGATRFPMSISDDIMRVIMRVKKKDKHEKRAYIRGQKSKGYRFLKRVGRGKDEYVLEGVRETSIS